MTFLIGFGIGFVAGWIVFERPAWATNLYEKAKAKLSG